MNMQLWIAFVRHAYRPSLAATQILLENRAAAAPLFTFED
jgi:hypothetical protein